MKVAYKKENGRLISVGLDGSEFVSQDEAELLTMEQAKQVREDFSFEEPILIMDEDDCE